MDTLINVPGISTVAELVENIIDKFGGVNARLKLTKEKDIKEPTTEFVVAVYVEYLRYLKIDTTVSVVDTQKYEYPEVFMDCIPMIKIFKPLRKFFARQKAVDFSMMDLIAPTYKRTHGGIAVLDNYISFCLMSMEQLSPKIQSIQEKINNMEEISKHRENLLLEEHKMNSARSQRPGKLAELDLLLSAKRSSCLKLTEHLNDKTSQEDDLMSKLQGEKLKTNTLKNSMQKVEEELNLQENLVVLEPEQIEREDFLKRESLKKMTEEIANFKGQLDRSQKSIQVFEQMMEMQSHFEKYTKGACRLKQALEEKESYLSNKEGTVATQDAERKSKHSELAKKKAAANKLKEHLTAEKVKADSRLAAMEKTVKQLKLERETAVKKIGSSSKACKEMAPLIKLEKEKAQQWIDTKIECEAHVVEKKNDMDGEVKKQGIEIDKILFKAHDTAKSLYVKTEAELAEIKRLLKEQKAKDAAEGRTLKRENQ